MRTSMTFVALVGLVALAGTAGATPTAGDSLCKGPTHAASEDGSSVRVLIVYENASVRDRCGGGHVRAVDGTVLSGRGTDIVPMLVARVDPAAMSALESAPGVERVTSDVVGDGPLPRTAGGAQSGATAETATPPQRVPWGVQRIDGVEAATAVGPNATGRVDVAVLDTGVDLDHPDVGDAVVWGADTTLNGPPLIGRQYADDTNGHGTHVAGTVAAADNDRGVVGVAPNVSVYSIQVLRGDRRGYYSWWVEGIEVALDGPDGRRGTADDADVVSMSLGGTQTHDLLRRAVATASEDAVVVVSSGNNGQTSDEVLYPAAYPESVAVGAINRNGDPTAFSSSGPAVDLAAPGAGIESTHDPEFGDRYTSISGTSMAAPHVSGAAALVIAADASDGTRSLSPSDVVDRLFDSAVDIHASGSDESTGVGRVDALAAVDRPIPSLRVGTDTPIAGEPITVTASATDPVDSVVRYNYSVDGTLLRSTTNATTTVTLPGGGTVSLTLTVTDASGLTASTTRNVTLSRLPVRVGEPTLRGSVSVGSAADFETTVDVANLVPGESVSGRLLATISHDGTVVDGLSRTVAEGRETTLSLSVTPETNGTTNVSVAVQYTLNGTTYTASSPNVTVRVAAESALTIDGVTPTSLDDDPLLEDIDGDGLGTVFDALTYYNNRQSPVIGNNPDRFDFDGDGTAGTLFDALALYRTVSA